MIRCKNRFDPQAFQPNISIQEVVDGGQFKGDMLESMVACPLRVGGEARKSNDADAMIGAIVGDPADPLWGKRRGSIGSRGLVVRGHSENLRIPVLHRPEVGRREAVVVKRRMNDFLSR